MTGSSRWLLLGWIVPPIASIALAWSPIELPTLCLWSRLLDIRCPGCGMTHAAMALLRGDPADAWRHSPLAFLVLPVLAGWYARLGGRILRPASPADR